MWLPCLPTDGSDIVFLLILGIRRLEHTVLGGEWGSGFNVRHSIKVLDTCCTMVILSNLWGNWKKQQAKQCCKVSKLNNWWSILLLFLTDRTHLLYLHNNKTKFQLPPPYNPRTLRHPICLPRQQTTRQSTPIKSQEVVRAKIFYFVGPVMTLVWLMVACQHWSEWSWDGDPYTFGSSLMLTDYM